MGKTILMVSNGDEITDNFDEVFISRVFVSKDSDVAKPGKWKSVMGYMGYSVGKKYRNNPSARRTILKTILFAKFSTDDDGDLKNSLDGYGEPNSEQRIRRMLGNLVSRTEIQIGSGRDARQKGPHWSYGTVKRTFDDGCWLVQTYGRKYGIIAYGNQQHYCVDEPLLIFRYTTMPTKCGFCYGKESYRKSVELHTEDEFLKCKICNRGFFETNEGTDDDDTNYWNRTNYRSHEDLILRRFSVEDFLMTEEEIEALRKGFPINEFIDKAFFNDHLAPIRADIDEMQGISGRFTTATKRYGLDPIIPEDEE